MSYCRFSSSNFQCDVYCYSSRLGYITQVAGRRVVGDVPKVPEIGTVPDKDWCEANKAQMKFLDKATYEAIDLPHAGKTFTDDTLKEFKARLIELKRIGYNVPDFVFDGIAEELEAA